jgi:hypothetical protein
LCRPLLRHPLRSREIRTGDVGTILSEWRDATVRLGQIVRAILSPAALIVSSWDSGESTDT